MAKEITTKSYGQRLFCIPNCVIGFSSDDVKSRMENAVRKAKEEMDTDGPVSKTGLIKAKSIGKGDDKQSICSWTDTSKTEFTATWDTATRFGLFCQTLEKLNQVVQCKFSLLECPEFEAWHKVLTVRSNEVAKAKKEQDWKEQNAREEAAKALANNTVAVV